MGAEETSRLVQFTRGALVRSVGNGLSESEVGWHLSVVKTGATIAQCNPSALMTFAATMSINQAVLNALPFATLDGGQLAFVAFELATDRALDRSLRETITALVLVLLLGLGVTTFVGDVERLAEPVVMSPEAKRPAHTRTGSRWWVRRALSAIDCWL